MIKHHKPQDVRQAAAQARRYAHGSLLHGEAMGVLLSKYREAHEGREPQTDPKIPGHSWLDELWAWVNDVLN